MYDPEDDPDTAPGGHDWRVEQDMIDEADALRLYSKGPATKPEHLSELTPDGRFAYGPRERVPYLQLGVPCGAEVRLTSAAGNGPTVTASCILDKNHDVRHYPAGGNLPESMVEEPTEHVARVTWS